jgi:RNA polymerase sigma factor (sigma-70 family)
VDDHQHLLTDQLEIIQQIVRATARKKYFTPVQTEDFAGYVSLKLIADDYAVLRKFKNRSTWWTYLVTVIGRLASDFQDEAFGRWRPSDAAVRIGAVAVLLEQFVVRDGHTLEEAVQILRTHHDPSLTDAALRDTWQKLPPRRGRMRFVDEEHAERPASETAEDLVEASQLASEIDRLDSVLKDAYEQLPSRDRLTIALRFDEGFSVAHISKLVGSSVPTLHRRFADSIEKLRAALVAAGFTEQQVSGLIGRSAVVLSPLLRAEVESFSKRVRLSKRDD